MGEFFILIVIILLMVAVLLSKSIPALKETIPFRKWLFATDEKSAFTKFMIIVIGSRLFLFVLGMVLMNIHSPGESYYNLLKENGDTPHYIWLAEHWYVNNDPAHNNLIVFYPLFPALIKLFSFVFQNYFLSGMIISNVATIAACGYLYKLIRLDYSKNTASNGVVFFLLYPFSMFLLSCYTEGLFILLCVMTAYYARKSKWILCGIIGMFAALTRTQGALMLGVVLYEYIIQAKEKSDDTWKGFLKKLSPKGLALLLIPLGFGIYLLMNLKLFGDPFKFLEFQKAPPWYQGFDYFPKNLAQNIGMAKTTGGLAYIIYIPQVVAFFAAFALVLYGAKRKVRTSYLLHIAAYTIVSFSSNWLISGGRYMLSCIFMFIPLALLAQNKSWRIVLLSLLATLNMYYFICYMFKEAIM